MPDHTCTRNTCVYYIVCVVYSLLFCSKGRTPKILLRLCSELLVRLLRRSERSDWNVVYYYYYCHDPQKYSEQTLIWKRFEENLKDFYAIFPLQLLLPFSLVSPSGLLHPWQLSAHENTRRMILGLKDPCHDVPNMTQTCATVKPSSFCLSLLLVPLPAAALAFLALARSRWFPRVCHTAGGVQRSKTASTCNGQQKGQPLWLEWFEWKPWLWLLTRSDAAY